MRLAITAAALALLACGAGADSLSRVPSNEAVRPVIEAYYAALNFKRCSRVDHYYITLHPDAAAMEGSVWPGLEPELIRFDRLRRLSVEKGLGAAISNADARWRDEDSRIDYVCADSPVADRIRAFRRINDDLEAALLRL